VLDVYKRPYNKAFPVVCMDESSKQLMKETRTRIHIKSGQEAKEEFEYERSSVANIFLVSKPLKGKKCVKVTEKKTKTDWAKFIKQIANKWYKDSEKITLVMENLATHKAAALYEMYPHQEAKRIWDRFKFVYTPKHCNWLNIAEIELKVLMGQCLNRRINKLKTMKDEVRSWQTDRNNKKATINWQFTNQLTKINLKR